jgi:hypothetical protein
MMSTNKQYVLPFTKIDRLKNIEIKTGKTLEQIADEVIAEIRKSLKKDLAEIKFAHSDMKNNFNMKSWQIKSRLGKDFGSAKIEIYWKEYGDR